MHLIKEKIMRNDFYVGMYEDRYLAHGIKGWIKKGHKYLSRFFKNGRWKYIYEHSRNADLSKYAAENAREAEYQAKYNLHKAKKVSVPVGSKTSPIKGGQVTVTTYVPKVSDADAKKYKQTMAGAYKSASEAAYRGRKAAEANLAWRKTYKLKRLRDKMQKAMDNHLVGEYYVDGEHRSNTAFDQKRKIENEKKKTGKVKNSSYRKYAKRVLKDYKKNTKKKRRK